MGIRGQFIKGAATIFKQAGDVPVDITYKVNTQGASDGMGGYADPTFTNKTNVQAFKYSYKQEELARSGLIISPGDFKLIIEQAVLTAQSVSTPKDKDEMIVEGQTVKIKYISEDPAGAVYFFQVGEK